MLQIRLLPDQLAEFIAREVWHCEVEDDEVRPKVSGLVKRLAAVRDDAGVKTLQSEKFTKNCGTILVVIDDQDTVIGLDKFSRLVGISTVARG